MSLADDNIVYGRMREGAHIVTYEFERVLTGLKQLLESGGWKQVGGGFDEPSAFVDSISLADVRMIAEQRKEIAELLTGIGASQRATARAIGVSEATVARDLGKDRGATNVALPPDEEPKNATAKMVHATNVAPLPNPLDVGGEKAAEQVQKKVHVSCNSGENEWYTPPRYIEAARAAMGSIDVDPASSEKANETVKAATFYDIATDGLTQEWFGRVWLNPPYSQPEINRFSEEIVKRYARGEVTAACVLVNNATETAWFQWLLAACQAVCFLSGRVKYLDASGVPANTPLQGQAVLYFGLNPDGFDKAFGHLGTVLRGVEYGK